VYLGAAFVRVEACARGVRDGVCDGVCDGASRVCVCVCARKEV